MKNYAEIMIDGDSMKHALSLSEINCYRQDKKTHGIDVAKANLLINYTKRMINAKRLKITYNKKGQ